MKAPRFLSYFCIVALALISASCSKLGKPSSHKSERTVLVEKKDLDFSVNSIGDLKPSLQVEVKIEISNGKVKRILVHTGDSVKKGDLVVELDDSDLLIEKASAEIEIDGSKLALNKASLAANRAKRLVAAEVISKAEEDNLRLDAEIAQNNLDKSIKGLQSVEDRLSKTRIMAPIDGTVIELPIVEGQVVIGGSSAAAAGTVLMKLANLSEMLISTHINQVDVARMQLKGKVGVTVDAFDGLNLTGEIVFIAPIATVKNNVKGFQVDMLVTSPDPRIRPGMSANVKIPITRVQGALSLPIEAVFREADEKIVYVKKGDDFERRQIQTGVTTTDRAEIKSGLKEGELILLNRPKANEKKS